MHCSFCRLSVIQTWIRLCVVHWVLTLCQLCPSHLRHFTPSLHSLACIWYSEPSTPPDDHTLGRLYWYSVPIHNTSGYLVACIWYSNHNLSSTLKITSSLPTRGVQPWSCTLFIAHSCGPLRGSVSVQASSSIIDKFPISERSSKSTSSRRSYWCVYQGGCWRRDEENK